MPNLILWTNVTSLKRVTHLGDLGMMHSIPTWTFFLLPEPGFMALAFLKGRVYSKVYVLTASSSLQTYESMLNV
jgi:hypothetical protein